MLRIFIAGQKSFGAAVYKTIKAAGYEITGVACPNDGKYFDKLKVAAYTDKDKPVIIDSEKLMAQDIPVGTDILITAHSHHYISSKVRAAVKYSIGYHPSLLPRHRGRDAVKWAVKYGETVTGGTVYSLSDSVDAGDIICQESVLIRKEWDYKELWKDALFPLGVRLILEAVKRIESGNLKLIPQDESLATWEPPIENRRLFRPELLMIE